LRELARGEWQHMLDPRSSRWFGDVYDDLQRVSEHLANLDSLLDGALQANVAAIGMRQNEDMRKLAAGAALVAVPTLIAGVYGMNFDEMPELHWSVGYPMSLGMMGLTSILLYWQFKKRKWL
jgi:magnesium transporter